MTVYATYTDFTYVYSVRNVSQAEVESGWLPNGAEELESRLGAYFTLPFSSNNLTARRLNIDFAYMVWLRRTMKQDDSNELERSLSRRVKDLTEGSAPMILLDGTPLYADKGAVNQFWSANQDEPATFNMLDAEEQRVSIDKRQRLLDEQD